MANRRRYGDFATKLLKNGSEGVHTDFDMYQIFDLCFEWPQSILIKVECVGKFMAPIPVEELCDDGPYEYLEV